MFKTIEAIAVFSCLFLVTPAYAIESRYWRLNMSKGNAIYEMQFYSGDAPPQVILTGTAHGVADANVNAVDPGHHQASKMFDGNLGMHYGGTEDYWQDFSKPAWVEYVFNEPPQAITRVDIMWYGYEFVGDLNAGPAYIESSVDGSTWTRRYEVLKDGVVDQGCTADNKWTWNIPIAADGCTGTTFASASTPSYSVLSDGYCNDHVILPEGDNALPLTDTTNPLYDGSDRIQECANRCMDAASTTPTTYSTKAFYIKIDTNGCVCASAANNCDARSIHPSGVQWRSYSISTGGAACVSWTDPTQAECADGSAWTAGSASADSTCIACTGTTFSTGGAACAAVATCDKKGDGSTANAVTDVDCGAGFTATVGATAACAAAPCALGTSPADKAACCTAVATCAAKNDGSTAAAVTNADCGAGFTATVSSTAACDAAPCNMATPADKAACCTAVATCAAKADGSTADAVTDDDCGTGFFATGSSTAYCAAAPCNMATPADKAACCTAVATCDKKVDGSTANAVTDGDCGSGFTATVGATAACAANPCALGTSPADKGACCTGGSGVTYMVSGALAGSLTIDVPDVTGIDKGYMLEIGAGDTAETVTVASVELTVTPGRARRAAAGTITLEAALQFNHTAVSRVASAAATEFTQCQAKFTVDYVAPMPSSLGPIILGKNSNGVSLALHPGQFRVGVTVHACDANGNLEAAPRYVGESSLTDFYDQGEELSITIVAFDTRQLEDGPATLDTNFAPVVASLTVSPLNLKPGEDATISTIGVEVNRDDGIGAVNFAVHDTAVCANPAGGDCVPVLEERNAFDGTEQRKELSWKFRLSNRMFEAYNETDTASWCPTATNAPIEWTPSTTDVSVDKLQNTTNTACAKKCTELRETDGKNCSYYGLRQGECVFWETCDNMDTLPKVEIELEGSGERCKGECDTDSDCGDGLKCFQRENGEPIPGCTGDVVAKNSDFCYNPEYGAVHRANPSVTSDTATGVAGQDLLGTVTVYENQTSEAQLSGFGAVPFYLDQLQTFNLGFLVVTQPTVAAIVGADQSLSARAVPCPVDAANLQQFNCSSVNDTTPAVISLKVLDSDFTTVPELGYTEKHTLVVNGIENANISYVSGSHKVDRAGCADLPGGCTFVECECTRDDEHPGYCDELRVEEGLADGASTWTLSWDPWASINSSTAALYGTTYCHLKLRFIDNSANLSQWPSDYVQDMDGMTSKTVTFLLEATPGVTAAVNLPPRTTQFYATNTKIDRVDAAAPKVTSYYVTVEDDAAGTKATLGWMDADSFVPFAVDVVHATNLGTGVPEGLAGQGCPTNSTTSANVIDTECPDTVVEADRQDDWLFTTQTCGAALSCDLTWELNVTTAVSRSNMNGTQGATNEVHLRLKDKGGVEVFVQMPSVRIETGRKRLARRDDDESLRTGQFNIAVDGNGRLTASEAAPFLVVPSETEAVPVPVTDADDKKPETAANNTEADADADGVDADVDADVDVDVDVDAHDVGGGADSLLGNKWALIPVIAAFVALLTSIIGLAVVCSNQRSARRAKAKVHPMSAEAINLA